MPKKLGSIFYRTEVGISSALMFATVVITTYNMLMRWLGFSVGDWFEESVTTLLSWSVFFGIGACIRDKRLVVVEVLTQYFSEKWRRIADILITVVSILLFSLLWLASLQLSAKFYEAGIVVYTMFNIPVYLVMSCIPVSMILWIYHLMEHLMAISHSGWRQDA